MPQIAQLIQVISEVQQYANTNVYGVAGLVYDLCTIFGAKMLPVLDNDHVTKFLTKNLKQSRNNRTKEMIHRSLRAITNLRMNPEQDKQRVSAFFSLFFFSKKNFNCCLKILIF